MVDIVVVDDEPVLLRNLARHLRRRGYSVAEARTVAAARELCTELNPAVLLTDYDLPDGTGLGLVAELRRRDCPCEAILITGRGGTAVAEAARLEGVHAYLEKPVSFEVLRRILSELHPAPAAAPAEADAAPPVAAPLEPARALAPAENGAPRAAVLLDAAERWAALLDRAVAADQGGSVDPYVHAALESAICTLYDAVREWRAFRP